MIFVPSAQPFPELRTNKIKISCSQRITSGLEERKGLPGDYVEQEYDIDFQPVHSRRCTGFCRNEAIYLLLAGLEGAVYIPVGGQFPESQPHALLTSRG